jgi:hypothetical protein
MSKISFIQSAPAEFRPSRSSGGGVFWPLILLFLLVLGLLALMLNAVNATVGTKKPTPTPVPPPAPKASTNSNPLT